MLSSPWLMEPVAAHPLLPGRWNVTVSGMREPSSMFCLPRRQWSATPWMSVRVNSNWVSPSSSTGMRPIETITGERLPFFSHAQVNILPDLGSLRCV